MSDWEEIKAIQKRASLLIEENARQMKQNDRKFYESLQELRRNDQKFKESMRRNDQKFKENMRRNDQKFKENMRQNDQKFKENMQKMKRNDRKVSKLESLFTNQWGKLMESLVKGDLLKLLRERNIEVDHFAKEAEGKRNGEDFEFDIIAINGREIVVTEVKTTMDVRDVDHFLEKLKKLTYYMPYYSGKVIYGAMAYLQAKQSSETYAEKNGLFVIRATGSSSRIINAKDFKAKVF